MAKNIVSRRCSAVNCLLPHSAHGYCKGHWARIVTHGDNADLQSPIRQRTRRPKYVGCSVDECGKPHAARGFCWTHYERWLKWDDPMYVTKGTTVNPWRIDDPEFAGRFWDSVDVGSDDECWEWRRGKTVSGYGSVSVELRSHVAHRIAWWLTYGKEPELMILHSCDNPPCCNPKHLREGTNQDNMRDMVERGRSKAPRTRQMNEETVRQVKEWFQQGVAVKDVAAQLGVSRSILTNIRTGRTWSHVTL